MANSTPNDGSQVRQSGITITAVRIRHFRCLRAVDVFLSPLTVLIGENNAGKTSILDALHAAIGSGQRQLSEDDVFLDAGETKPPRDRTIEVVRKTLGEMSAQQLSMPYPLEFNGRQLPTGMFLLHLATLLAYHLGQIDYHRRTMTGDDRGVGVQSIPDLLDG